MPSELFICVCLPLGEAITWGCCVARQHSLVFTESKIEHVNEKNVWCLKSDFKCPFLSLRTGRIPPQNSLWYGIICPPFDSCICIHKDLILFTSPLPLLQECGWKAEGWQICQNSTIHWEIPDTVVIAACRATVFSSIGSLCWACLSLFRQSCLVTF